MKVALVGNGNIYNLAHIYAWKSMKDVEIHATCDIIQEKAERACKESGASKYYTNINDLMSDDRIDVIDICVPTYEHARLSITALNAGKHVICEKPIARDTKSAAEMLEAAEKNNKGLYIGHTRRYDARWMMIKENIDSGKIGTPLHIRRCERSWLPFPVDSWYWDPEKSGGVLMDIGIHCIDFANWFFGLKPREVYAHGRMIRDEAKEKGVYDLATVMIGYEGGKTALIDVGWAYPKVSAPFYSSLDIIGTNGRIEYSDKNANPMVFAGESIEFPRYSPLLSANLEAFKREIHEFVECIRSGKKPSVTAHEALDALATIAAAEESIKNGEVTAC